MIEFIQIIIIISLNFNANLKRIKIKAFQTIKSTRYYVNKGVFKYLNSKHSKEKLK